MSIEHRPARRKSLAPDLPPDDERSVQFVKALTSRGGLLGSISVEPVAFLAILALYIEFPSIQDLIYTRICLNIVSDRPVPQFNNSTIEFANTTSHDSYNSSSTAALSSRQTQATNFTSNPISPPIIDLSSSSDMSHSESDRLMCDRRNKSAVSPTIAQEIASHNALFWLKYQLLICLLCTLASPYWGGISDRIGRIIPLNVPIIAAVLSNLISLTLGLSICLDFYHFLPVEVLFIGAVITGLSGGQAVIIVSAFSFIGDNTSVSSRSKRVTVLEAVIYLSHSVGFYLTQHIMTLNLAQLIHGSSIAWWLNRHFVAFALCILLNLLSVLYSSCKLRHHKFHRLMNNFEREQQDQITNGISQQQFTGSAITIVDNASVNRSTNTLHTSQDRPRELTVSTPDDLDGPVARSDKRWSADWSLLLTFRYYRETMRTAVRAREARSIILLLLLCGLISTLSLVSLMSLLYIYLRNEPFGWTTSRYSWWNSITSITRGVALVLLSLCMKFVQNWNVPDPLVAAVGFACKGAGLLMIGLAQTSTILDWSLLPFVLSEFTMPPIRSLLSKLVTGDELGKIYSCLGALQNICFLMGNIIFYMSVSIIGVHNFYLCFIVVAVCQFVAVIIMFYVYANLQTRRLIV